MYENYSVLFVDDEIHILSSLRRGLLDEEYTCHFAESGMKAIEILESKKVHVIITDMRMPEMNGLELLKHVESNYPEIIKLVLSGYTQLTQVLATINQVDIFNFITKPWSIDELIIIVRKALDHYILLEENANYKVLLETKNQSYQNILKRIDDVIDNERKSTELLRICGKEILSFGKNFTLEERNTYYEIFSKQYAIYNTLSKAASIERKDYESSQLVEQISDLVTQLCPDVKIDKKICSGSTLLINMQMLDALLSSIIILFQDEFTQNGLYLNFSYDNRFLISIISPNTVNKNVPNQNGTIIFDRKIAFIRNLVEKISSLCQITLQILNKDDNLIIGFSFEEQ